MTVSVGEPLDRVDGRLKVTGAARYSAEWRPEGLVHAALVTSVPGRGRVRSVDARAARVMPGVIAVFSPDSPLKYAGDPSKPGEGPPLHVLDRATVDYSGQPVALVVADTFERAIHAAARVRVNVTEEEPEASQHPSAGRILMPPAGGSSSDSVRGDVERGLGSAAVRIDATYVTPFEQHAPMEPHATIAQWETPDRLTVWEATQGVFDSRDRLAELFGLKPKNVRVIAKFVGGGFGCKGSLWSHAVLAAAAARAVGRPVKLVLSRQAMFGNVGYRPRTEQRLRLGATADGTLTAIEHNCLNPTSAFGNWVERCTRPTRMLYACPNVRTTQRMFRMNVGLPTYARAPGTAPGNFALESAMDELAWALKMDPLALRLKNHADRDPDSGKAWSTKSLKECYHAAAERFGWSKRPLAPGQMRDGEVRVGWGMATASYPTHRSPASARMTLRPDGTLRVVSGASEIGTGTYTVIGQVAADASGIPVERVAFDLGDSSLPQAPGAGGSRQSASVAAAVHAAGQTLKAHLIALAQSDSRSPSHGAKREELGVFGGRVGMQSDPRRSEEVGELLVRQGLPELTVEASTGGKGEARSTHAFGAVFAEARVDPLGQARVSRVVASYGVGRVLNQKLARSQLIGGVTFGLGMALTEEIAVDPRSGRFVTRDLADYHIPVNADVPEMDVQFVNEVDLDVSEVGSKGIGELGITGAPAAVANAIWHATEIRVRELPITPDKLLGTT
jgi:xanthine dehydrogenase YagR molybdenum-binding subunit